MFVRLENTPRDYAWGSTTAIAELLGHEPSGGPEAELWLGAHPGSPTRIADPAATGGFRTLAELVEAHPEFGIGFLLKILAAEHPLSLQAHPTLDQARAGFAREDAAGVPLSSAIRNYKDRNHKPELIVALSPTFDALCGFRSRENTLTVLREFIEVGRGHGISAHAVEVFVAELAQPDTDEDAMKWALEWLLTGGSGVPELVGECVELARVVSEKVPGEAPGDMSSRLAGGLTDAIETILELAAEYPGDPGIVLALLLNRVRLARGEALYLPAGNLHAYLRGLGVELMASSDNVLRGGLTPKNIDVPELLAITQCRPLPIPTLLPTPLAAGVEVFAPGVADFALVHVLLNSTVNDGQAVLDCDGPAIVIALTGEVALRGKTSSAVLQHGEFCFVTPDEGRVVLEGSGELFVARKGLTPDFDQQVSK